MKTTIALLRNSEPKPLTSLWGLIGPDTNYIPKGKEEDMIKNKKKKRNYANSDQHNVQVVVYWTKVMLGKIRATIARARRQWGRQLSLCELSMLMGISPWLLRDFLTEESCKFYFGEYGSLLPMIPLS
jgi:hypothetical protein